MDTDDLRRKRIIGPGSGRGAPPEPAFQRDAAPADLEPYEGRPVRRVILETPPAEAGGPPGSLDEATLALCRNQLRLRAGAPFVSGVVTEDVSRLNRLGRFRSVEARVRQHSDGWVDVVFRVSPQPVIEAVQVVGNKRLDDNAILGMVEILNGTPVDPTQLDRACRRIEERYLELGYYNCRVSVDEKELTANRIVVFRVREGDRTKITGIRFEGNNAFTGGELRQQIKTNEARFLGFFKGRLDGEQIVNDAAALVGFYRDRGYLDVRTDRIVTPSPDGSEAIVTFVIDEGPLYTLRGVRITYEGQGTPLFSPEQLLSLMKIRPGDAYGLKVLNQSIEDIRRAYWAEGYPDVAIDRRELRDEGSPQVDLALLVREVGSSASARSRSRATPSRRIRSSAATSTCSPTAPPTPTCSPSPRPSFGRRACSRSPTPTRPTPTAQAHAPARG